MPSRGYLLSSICSFVILVNVVAQAQLNFAPAVVYPSGTGDIVTAVAISDLNGDGTLDVVAGGGDEVGVLLGNGDGTLKSDGSYDSGGNGSDYEVNSVAVADLNGDGNPDIVVVNSPGLIGVLLGSGNGTFGRAQSFNSGGWSSDSVAVADMNGDGKPDLIVANGCVSFSDCSKSSVGILLGNGDGTFQPAVTYFPGGLSANSVVVADVNNDGKPDVLVIVCTALDANAACVHGAVAVLLGKGDGTFSRPLVQQVALSPESLAVADVNGDGKDDLIITGCVFSPACTGGVIAELLGKGDGTFEAATYFPAGAGSVVAADVNGDGKLDLVFTTFCLNCADDYNGAVGVMLGKGNGKFQPAVTFPSGGYQAGEVAVADLNGDGKPDIVVTTCNNIACEPNPEIGVLINTSDSPKKQH